MARKKSIKLNWRYIIPAVIVAALVVITGLEVFSGTGNKKIDLLNDSDQSANSSQVDTSDPVEKAKSETPRSGDNKNQNTNGKTKAKVEVVFAGQESAGQAVTVRGFAEGVFEDGGRCTATLTKAGDEVSGTSEGFMNVSYTQCAEISIPRSQFGSGGTWILKLKYSSPKAEGISSQQEVPVQ